MIQPKGAKMTWLAGIYRLEDGLPVFAVLTREPPEELKKIHDRMPLIFPEEFIDAWISPKYHPEEILPHALSDMITEKV